MPGLLSWTALLLVCAPAVSPGSFGSRPHIVFVLADNLGWANVGWHTPPETPKHEIQTPNLDALVADGLELDRFYTYKFCSPSRSSLLTGRFPMHVNIYNDNPTMEGAGVPTNMTMISSKLTDVGYRAHFVGKWHVGMARDSNTPLGKGFASSLGYFHSTNNYYDSTRAEGCDGLLATDLWDTDRPASYLNGTAYEERLFAERAVQVVNQHPNSSGAPPLFMYYAAHSSCVGYDTDHDVLQPDAAYYDKFAFVPDKDRRSNRAMVALLDAAVGNLTRALRDRGMWERTLFVWASDNGGAVHLGGGANSWPLRGGYYNNWEGGTRTPALVAGGFLPDPVRGTKLEGFVHEADWYATFCWLAGTDPVDHSAASAVPPLPPVDSLNVWRLLTGENTTSPRFEWPLTPLGENTTRAPHGGDAGYMHAGWKLLVGDVRQAGWCGQVHPNASSPWDSFETIEHCTVPSRGKLGCLFNIVQDPEERNDLALTMPDKAAEMMGRLKAAQANWFNPDRGQPDQAGCDIAKATGFWQPFLK